MRMCGCDARCDLIAAPEVHHQSSCLHHHHPRLVGYVLFDVDDGDECLLIHAGVVDCLAPDGEESLQTNSSSLFVVMAPALCCQKHNSEIEYRNESQTETVSQDYHNKVGSLSHESEVAGSRPTEENDAPSGWTVSDFLGSLHNSPPYRPHGQRLREGAKRP